MRKLILAIGLLCLSCPAWATWSVVQHTIGSGACTSGNQTCNLTVSATGSGHLIIVSMVINYTGEYITGISDGGSTYVVNSGGLAGNACAAQDAGAPNGSDCGYTLSSVSGKTTITVTRTDNTSHIWRIGATEYSFSGTSISFDVVGVRDQSAATTTPAGVTLSLSGTNDAIYQIDSSGLPSSITTYGSSDFAAHMGAASLINTNSGTAPTWTQSSNPSSLSAIAFSETTGGAASTAGGPAKFAGPNKVD